MWWFTCDLGFHESFGPIKVRGLELLTPGMGHVYCPHTFYPSHEQTFFAWEIIAHRKDVIYVLRSWFKVLMKGRFGTPLSCYSSLEPTSAPGNQWPLERQCDSLAGILGFKGLMGGGIGGKIGRLGHLGYVNLLSKSKPCAKFHCLGNHCLVFTPKSWQKAYINDEVYSKCH